MNERLKVWQTERERIAAAIRHDRIGAQVGADMLTDCDERIAEHRDGIIPAQASEEETAAADAPRLAGKAHSAASTLEVQRQRRDRALAKYRADMLAKTGRDPAVVSGQVFLHAMAQGRPFMSPWLYMMDQDGADA